MRKNPAIWDKWSVGSSHSLHTLQLTIARRGLQLLRPGGLLVYSTCSMSPYEDEAVVAELLRGASQGELELVDARSLFIPHFKARPGLSAWHVFDDARRPQQQQQQQQQQGQNGGVEADKRRRVAPYDAPQSGAGEAVVTATGSSGGGDAKANADANQADPVSAEAET